MANKKTFKLVGSFTTQEANPPKEEYKVSKETLNLLKNHGKHNESCCHHGARSSHQVHRLK